MTSPMDVTIKRTDAVLREVSRVVVGKRDELQLIMIAVLSGGHILIEDLPGLGKTLIARSFATALGLNFT
ncbi:AAA family ATPase, partial [Streptomyces sp. NPDC101166]